MGICVKQRFRRHENPGSAIAALRRPKIRESILQRMQSPISGKPFDRQDFSSTALERENQAGEHGPSIQKNGARAALSQLAAVLGSCMA